MTALKKEFRGLCLVLAAIAGALAAACEREAVGVPGPDPQIVTALTGGVIPRNGEIELVFTEEQDISKPLRSNFLRIKPAVNGSLSWKNNYTLVFSPASLLPAAQRFEATAGDKALGIPPFSFSFETSPALVELSLDPVAVTEGGDALVSGLLATDEGEAISRIEKAVSSPELGKPRWTHAESEHRFAFDPVKREADGRTVSVRWDGNALGAKENGTLPVRIPGNAVFEAVDCRIRERGALEVTFSAPLKPDQDLRGFISLSGDTNVRYSIEGNLVKIFGVQGADGVGPGAELLIQDLPDSNGAILARPV
ncbi:MAG: alpha-2-macroglobulin, partial [Treponema sp.]|nr:alpha-2-macroglobulin [Treponema sp.]